MRGLELESVWTRFGGVYALQDVSVDVDAGELVAIIGPNGAGKTSLVNCISGVYLPEGGAVRFESRAITRSAPGARTRLGIARTFQNIALFKGMTVLDNLLIGRHFRQKTGLFAGGFYYGPGQREEIKERKVVEEIIDFLEIEHIRKKGACTPPYRLPNPVELPPPPPLDPHLLLLDEPMAGMNNEEKDAMARFIVDVNDDKGTAIVMAD